MPSDAAAEPTEVCPGCAAVLVRLPGTATTRPGASASCARLFEVTLRGLREEAGADPAASAAVRRADAAYEAQHADAADPERTRRALEALGAPLGKLRAPTVWRTTIADVAADLDVIDLAVLIEAWARSVVDDWAALGASGKPMGATCN